MKNLSLFVYALAFLACNNTDKPASDSNTNPVTKQSTPPKDSIKALGSDRDEHGCIGSAGQTWSTLRAECIQVFNVGRRLNPVDTKTDEAIISAFAVYNSDSSKAEIFLPGEANTTILDRSTAGVYGKDPLIYNATNGTLSQNNKVTYKAEVVK